MFPSTETGRNANDEKHYLQKGGGDRYQGGLPVKRSLFAT